MTALTFQYLKSNLGRADIPILWSYPQISKKFKLKKENEELKTKVKLFKVSKWLWNLPEPMLRRKFRCIMPNHFPRLIWLKIRPNCSLETLPRLKTLPGTVVYRHPPETNNNSTQENKNLFSIRTIPAID